MLERWDYCSRHCASADATWRKDLSALRPLPVPSANALRRYFPTWTGTQLSAPNSLSFFFQAEDGIRGGRVTGVQTCALPISGKHIYCEKPVSTTLAEAKDLYAAAKKARVKHGVVQDKLWLPGLLKLKKLRDQGFFGRLLSVRGEFGYWVFEGDRQKGQPAAQRPSWNYRARDGGGIILDMLCHWRYVLDNLFGEVKAVSCRGATHVPWRWDENGRKYKATADDAAYATFELAGGVIAHFNSSWTVRVRRDDLLTLQVDGTQGSAVAGLRRCLFQSYDKTPKPVWNPDIPQPIDFFAGWQEVPDENTDNAFKAEWELFLKHVAGEGRFRWNLLEAAKGVQLAELGLKSWKQRKWLDVPKLKP